MKFHFVILFCLGFIIEPTLANDESVVSRELRMIHHSHLDLHVEKMEDELKKRNLDSCLYHIEQIESIASKEYFREYYFKAIAFKAKVLLQTRRHQEADSIYQFILSDSPTRELKIEANKYLAKIYTEWGRYDDAIDCMEIVHNEWTKEERRAEKYKYYQQLGAIYFAWGNTSKGLEYYFKVYQSLLETGNRNRLGGILFTISEIYKNCEVYEMAIEYSQKAEENILVDDNRWFLYINLAEIYISMEMLDSATFYIDKTMSIDTLSSFTTPNNFFLCTQSKYYTLAKSYDKAYDMGIQALEMAKEKRNPNSQIFAYEALANVFYHQGKYEQALSYLDTVETMGAWFLDLDMRKQRADILFKQKKWEAANKDLNIIALEISQDPIKSDLFELNNNLITENYDLEEKKTLLEEEEAKENFSRQRRYTLILAILSLAALFITYFFRRLYKKKEAYASIIETQNQELGEMNEFNHKLFYTLGHDLRSPINSLEIIFNEMLHQRISPQDFVAILPSLKKSVTGTSLTLNNILQWGLIKNEVIKEESASYVDIFMEAEHVRGMLSSSMKLKNIEFINQVPEGLVIVADNYRINLIFRNLISNSIKFTPENGQISIAAEESKDKVLIKISDTGMGIEKNRQERLFDSKTSTSGTNSEKGFGVGLSLCKEIIVKMNGRIWVESELGEGSTFFIEIPFSEEKED